MDFCLRAGAAGGGALTSGFDQTRSGLEEQWNEGEEASTEDLRVALTRYRAFFNRLLKI